MKSGPLDNLAIAAALDRVIRAHGGDPQERAADVHSLRQLEIAITEYVTEAVHHGAYYECPLCGEAPESE